MYSERQLTINRNVEVFQSMETAMMQLDDDAFVRQSYLRLLGRSADPEGFAGYIGQLQHGVARADIYHDLAISEEAQRYEARRQALRRTLTVLRPAPQALPVQNMPVWFPVNVSASTPAWEVATPSVAHVNDLLDLEGIPFIKAAYVVVLGREVDEAGGASYAGRLREGWSKMSLIKALVLSSEGRAFGSKRPALARALYRYSKAQRRSWGGWYYRSVLGVESDLPLERQLRAAHQALVRM